MRPRLWLLHQDGEDMIELEGFVEKLGTNKFDLKKCLTVAEQMLAFMRWRAPAVLEYWGEGSPALADRRCTLAQSFSDLSFMDPPRSGLGRTPSRTAGLIRADALPGILSSDIFSLNLVAPTAPTTESYLRARLTANMGRREAVLSLGREIEFEGGRSSHCGTAVLGCPIPCRGPNTRVRQRSAVASYLARHRLGFRITEARRAPVG